MPAPASARSTPIWTTAAAVPRRVGGVPSSAVAWRASQFDRLGAVRTLLPIDGALLAQQGGPVEGRTLAGPLSGAMSSPSDRPLVTIGVASIPSIARLAPSRDRERDAGCQALE